MKKGKIIYIANARIPTEKAHGTTIIKSCESLAEAGFDVELVVPRRKNKHPTNEAFSFYNAKRNFKITSLPTLDIFNLEKYIGRLAFWIENYSFYFFVFFKMLFAGRKTTVYSRDIPALFLKFYFLKVIYECHHLPRSNAVFFKIAGLADKIIVISNQLKESFLRAGFSSKRILVAPSGVDLGIFKSDLSKEKAREKLNLPKDKKIIAYTGNFKTFGMEKGILNIIESLSVLPKDVIFAAVGGKKEDVDFYKKITENKNLQERVLLEGHVTQQKLAIYQRAADVLLMPFPDTRHYREHMSPVKMFEYMASGRPIIASDLPTIREVLNDNNAVIIPPDNSRLLSEAISKILQNPEIGERLAAEAVKEVEKYSWQNRAKKILDFIDDVEREK